MDLLPEEAENELAFRNTSPVSALTFRISFDETSAAVHLEPIREMGGNIEYNMGHAGEELLAAATGEPNMNREVSFTKTLDTPEGVVVLTISGHVSDTISEEVIGDYVEAMLDTVDL